MLSNKVFTLAAIAGAAIPAMSQTIVPDPKTGQVVVFPPIGSTVELGNPVDLRAGATVGAF